jgi:pimeloyl-ACP methyl ester carboxylesterase
MPKPRSWTLLLAAAAGLASLALSGCEAALSARAEKAHPPEGRMVALPDGRRLQMDCRGEGAPTVVLQSGGDLLGALAWVPVMQRTQGLSRVCAYSRAGILWSDPARGAFEPEEVVDDLRAALKAAGEAPPYVLVGHSRGGLYAIIQAGLYPGEVAGLVLVDSSHPDQEQALEAAGVARGSYVGPGEEVALALRFTGLMRLSRYPVDADIAERVRAFLPKSSAANAREARDRDDILKVAGRHRDLRNWPVVVLAREPAEMTAERQNLDARNGYLLAADGLADGVTTLNAETVWRRLQADLASWSSRGRLQVVPNSTHGFFYDRPETVAAAISEVLAAARVVRRPTSAPKWGLAQRRLFPPVD